jgi:UDP-N-acetylglucosamine 4,6-dehydratase/5-epimerase
MLKNEKIFITGGAGSLGRALVKRFYEHNDVTVFSRDENKQYFLKKQYPNITCIVGDIRNYTLLEESMQGHTIAIFTASLKQIESVNHNVSEAVEIIIQGALNSRKAAIKNNLKAATFVSTDKSRNPTTLYGAMKLVAGEAFIMDAEKETTKLSTVVFGNLLDSAGSVLPLMWDSIRNDYALTLFGKDMTRFMMDLDDAAQYVEYALEYTGYNIIPNLQAFKVKDLFDIFTEKFKLKWNHGEPRLSEKIHEHLFAEHEISRTSYNKEKDMYLVHHKNIVNEITVNDVNFSSETTISKEEFAVFLEKKNYFKPREGSHLGF